MGIHNIQCWKNSAVGLVGLATGRQELVREAIEDPERGFRAQVEKGITADGLWFEGSLGYHQYTMSALWPLAEAARRGGIDLYSDRYRTIYDAPLALALPNGDSPGFNDSAGANVKSYGPLYELAYARWRKQEYGYLVANTRRDSLEALLYGREDALPGPIVPAGSVVLRDAGYAALRSLAMTAAIRFGMHGGGHGHPDKLNLVTFGRGRLGGLDPGSINYGVPLHQEWYRSTIAHNTVSVDQELQRNEPGRLEKWAVENGVTRLVASADTVYGGVRLRRSLSLNASELLDLFECASEDEHTYDWAFHVPGRFSSTLPFEPASATLGDSNGYQHVRALRHAETPNDFTATWDLGATRLILEMKGAPETEIFAGEGPGKKPEDRVSVLVVRRRTSKTTFEAKHRFVE
jgi:hypothetical protein